MENMTFSLNYSRVMPITSIALFLSNFLVLNRMLAERDNLSIEVFLKNEAGVTHLIFYGTADSHFKFCK